MNTQHIESRLETRGLKFSPTELQAIARKYEIDTALIVGNRPSEEGARYEPDNIILIIRGRRPITIMTRRKSQNIDKRNFNVAQVKYL